MYKARFKQIIFAIGIGFLFTDSGMAESSKEYAVMARETWSAFECSALAEKSKDMKDYSGSALSGYKIA